MELDQFEVTMENVEKNLGYRFVSRRDLLREALTSGAFAAADPDPIRHHGRGKGDTTRLATTMEAIIGALYEDMKRDLDRTADVVLPLLGREL